MLAGRDLVASFLTKRTEEAEAFSEEGARWEKNQTGARLRFNAYEHTIGCSLIQTDGAAPLSWLFIDVVLAGRFLRAFYSREFRTLPLSRLSENPP